MKPLSCRNCQRPSAQHSRRSCAGRNSEIRRLEARERVDAKHDMRRVFVCCMHCARIMFIGIHIVVTQGPQPCVCGLACGSGYITTYYLKFHSHIHESRWICCICESGKALAYGKTSTVSAPKGRRCRMALLVV